MLIRRLLIRVRMSHVPLYIKNFFGNLMDRHKFPGEVEDWLTECERSVARNMLRSIRKKTKSRRTLERYKDKIRDKLNHGILSFADIGISWGELRSWVKK